MVNNEYIDTAENFFNDDELSSDDEEEIERFYTQKMQYEEWCDWHSEHLLNMWMSLRSYNEMNYDPVHLSNRLQYSDFCEFVYKKSLKLP